MGLEPVTFGPQSNVLNTWPLGYMSAPIYIQTYIHTYIHTYMCACMHACEQMFMRTYMHTYVHAHIRSLHATRLITFCFA